MRGSLYLGHARAEFEIDSLKKHELEDLMQAARAAIAAKYPKQKRTVPLYGNLPRAWSAEQVEAFLRACSPDARVLFARQFLYGLRVSEACRARIVEGQALVMVPNDKAGRVDYMPLVPGSEVLFVPCRSENARVHARWFRETRDLLGPSWRFRYAAARDGRLLGQYSTHTLRRSAANILREHTHDPYKAAIFLRHRPSRTFGATAAYLHYPLDQLRNDMAEALWPLIIEVFKDK